jgi:transcriptional regulator
MHPNNAFRVENRELLETLIESIGFGMVFAQTPDGPRVAHTPMVSDRAGKIHFHLANGNALTKHLDGMTALAVINGPDAYISPRWYEDRDAVPTWNYVTLELEGPVRKLPPESLAEHVGALAARHEGALGGDNPWTIADLTPDKWARLFGSITGFEMEVKAWRPTFKLSQNKSADEREMVADALEEEGSPGLATLMRRFAETRQ